ncbi:MAG: hypothetical protein ACR2OD_05155 [Gaiellaceae bacterium]
MSSRSCPDWPTHMELSPELHFKHYTLAEARLPGEVLATLADVPADALVLCADPEHNVYNRGHTDPRVEQALADSHWLAREEWLDRRPG